MHFSPTYLEQMTRDHQQGLLAEAEDRRLARLVRQARLDDTPCAERRPRWRQRFLIGQRQALPC